MPIVFLVSPDQVAMQSVLLVAAPILVIMLALFYSLTVEIRDNNLVCQFGIGLIRRQIPLSDIRDARPVRNPWYVGWGIRWMPGQYWLWNVSGLSAVELLLQSGARFRIGTDEPENLVKAIEANKISVT
jgi:hypothetical protein